MSRELSMFVVPLVLVFGTLLWMKTVQEKNYFRFNQRTKKNW